MKEDGAGLLIIRAWIEEDSEQPLRATLRRTTDVSVGIERDLLFADPEAVCAAVGEWLDDMMAAGRGPAT